MCNDIKWYFAEIFDEGPKNDDLLGVKLAKKWYAVCMDLGNDMKDSRVIKIPWKNYLHIITFHDMIADSQDAFRNDG